MNWGRNWAQLNPLKLWSALTLWMEYIYRIYIGERVPILLVCRKQKRSKDDASRNHSMWSGPFFSPRAGRMTREGRKSELGLNVRAYRCGAAGGLGPRVFLSFSACLTGPKVLAWSSAIQSLNLTKTTWMSAVGHGQVRSFFFRTKLYFRSHQRFGH